MRSSVSKSLLYIGPAASRNLLRSITDVNADGVNEGVHLKSWKEIPGPYSLPIFGQLHHFLPGGSLSDLRLLQKELYEKYGPIVRLDGMLGKPPNVLLFDPEMCAQVLRSENWMPVRPGFFSLEYYRKYHNKTKEQSLKPTGLITDHGENWKQFRSTVNPVMLQPKTIKLYANVLEQVADDMIARMRSIRNKENMLKGQFDVEMNLWSLESIGILALGRRLNCFDPNLAEDSPERKLIQCVHDLFVVSNDLDFKPNLWRYYSTRKFKEGMKLFEQQEKLAKYFIGKSIQELNENNNKSEDEKSILEKLLEIDEEVALIMATDMLFAGVDTSATAVTGILYLLATNPKVQIKLREDLQNDFESKKYLKACVKEGMRVLPVVGGNMRQCTKEYHMLGYRIPKDMFVIFCHQNLSVDEKQFPKAKEYIPERWIDKDSPLYYTQAHPFAFSPFGFGVRGCIGRRIAELEIETILRKIILNFQVDWVGPPPEIFPASLNYIKGPFNFIFKDV